MDPAVPELLSKGKFAELIKVSPGRVSQYISDGKIGGAALHGEGRLAKIRVRPALEQLRLKLDISQMMGNGLDTQLVDPNPRVSEPHVEAPTRLPLAGYTPQPQPTLPDDRPATVEEKLKNEKLRQAQIQSRKAAEEEEHRKGRFTETDKVRAEMAGLLAKTIQTFEGSYPDVANAIAAKFEVSARDVLHLMRAEFRTVRERAAEQARREVEEMPKTVEAEIVQ
ncbi:MULTISPECIES: hypothetical protein [unclassified Roseibium]|uniref:hypothetical protein n=1 Tax=unclassified Roseibium TaxID=2629323 RepID=UPI00273D8FF4|nr:MULTISPECIES: hypothetical protein [unclassified Roseibium]